MRSVYGRNIHEVLPKALSLIRLDGHIDGPRASVGPISIEVTNPSERLTYGTSGDLCPFAALFTALWTLGGREDVQFLAKFNGYRQGSSDDGQVCPSAYGMRMRGHFWSDQDPESGFPLGTIDQLQSIVLMFRKRPNSGPHVIALWDASTDLGLQSPNTPRATHLYLSISNDNTLDMMVVYRNADLAELRLDSIVFSMIQEYIAAASGIFLGRMSFVINNFTVDTESLAHPGGLPVGNPYKADVLDTTSLVNTDPEHWLGELSMFLDEGPVLGMREPFFRHVASPMWQAWEAYKNAEGRAGMQRALDIVARVRAPDWRGACEEWLKREIDDRT